MKGGGGEHRRGRSMGSSTARPESKDEDLALFHEMKCREKHNFLHPSADDLDVSLSSKFGVIGTPVKKTGGTDLLTTDADKNDYDWLLTPPGTPLFPSLDQEGSSAAADPTHVSHPASSSANASKAVQSPADPSPKSSRGYPSPRRSGSTTANGTMSRSRSTPHNSTSVVAAVARPSTPVARPSTPTSSAARSSTPTAKSSSTPSVRSSTPSLKLSISASKSSSSAVSTPTATRPSTPNARSSTPPVRPSTPGARSPTPTSTSKPSTPTMRRSLSGGRAASSPATTRGGPSPKRTTSSRGNSPAAKRITSVITTVAGMSSEVPPNLRTTLTERPSTPKSGSNGSRSVSESGHASDAMDASGRSRRRPRSPSVTRSFSSSSSQDQRTTSSQTSRGSVISSYDDGIEVSRPTLQSSRNSAAGKWHAPGHEDLLSGKANTNVQAKRVTKSLVVPSGSSIGTLTKKSLEPNKWQGEAYQHSPSSYRHLVASSPGSPFYNSRTNSLLVRPASAMNSSVTTSSNASSEHGTTVAPDTEGSERDDDDLLSWDSYGRRMSPSPRAPQADILMLDKDDEKMDGWQDYERITGNDLAPAHRPGSQTSVDTEDTSFYENDGMGRYDMLEQFGLVGETYGAKKGSPGERVLERRTSNVEDGKVEARRSVERTLQRRASNIEDSRIPELRRSDHETGLIRPGSRSGREGSSAPSQGLKLKRQELLESLSDSRKPDGGIHRNSGEKTLGSQKNKVSSAEIHAACLFVRDFRVGLAPTQGQETVPAVSDDATNTNWTGNGDSIMSRKDLGSVRETLDFSQQKPNMSDGGNSFAQMESTLPRRPQTRRKAGEPQSVVPLKEEVSARTDALPFQAEDDDSGNTNALSVLVGVMERIKQESSQPKYMDSENRVPKRKTATRVVEDVDTKGVSPSQMPEIRTGPSHEGIHSMDEAGSPELHDIEEDSLMYHGGKDELELLESLHVSALRKEEARMVEETTNGRPKRERIRREKVEELPVSPKRTCIESSGDSHMTKRDAVELQGTPSFSHEEADVTVMSMDLDEFLRPGEPNELEAINGDAEYLGIPNGFLMRRNDHNQESLNISDREKTVFVTSGKPDETKIEQTAGAGAAEVAGLLSSPRGQQKDSSALTDVAPFSADRGLDAVVPNSSIGLNGADGCSPAPCIQVNTLTVHTLPDQPDHKHQGSREKEVVPLNQKAKDTPDASSDASSHESSGSYHAQENDVYSGAVRRSKRGEVYSMSPPHQERNDSRSLAMESAEESPNQETSDEKVEKKLPLGSSMLSPYPAVGERPNSLLVETSQPGSRTERPQTEINPQHGLRSTVPEAFSDTEGVRESNQVVRSVDRILPGKTLEEIHQEKRRDEEISAASEGDAVFRSSEKSKVLSQLKDPVHPTDADEARSMDRSVPSALEAECSQKHEAVSRESPEVVSSETDEPTSEDRHYLAEEIASSLCEDVPSSESVEQGSFVADSILGLSSLSKPEGSDSQDFNSGILNHISRRYSLDSNHVENSETGSSGEIECLAEAEPNHRNVSQVTRSSDSFLTNGFERSLRHYDTEESQSVDYVDTVSMETSVYYEATSEEKEDNQEVTSAYYVEEKEAVFLDPSVLSREHWDEDTSTVPSTLSELRNVRRNASSLCAALEVQLAGLIQKIDCAIEESGKPQVPGQHEFVEIEEKPSARLEPLREEEPDNPLEPVKSSQGEDMPDKSWPEDGRSKREERGANEVSQPRDSTPFGKDDTLNQLSDDFQLSQASENELTPLSNGHETEVTQESGRALHQVPVEEVIQYEESPKTLAANEGNFKDDGASAEASAHSSGVPVFDEYVKEHGEHRVSIEQQDLAQSPQLSTEVPFENIMHNDFENDRGFCKESVLDKWASSDDDSDPWGEDVRGDDVPFQKAQVEELSRSACDDLAPHSGASDAVTARAAGGEDHKHEDETGMGSVGETFPLEQSSLVVKGSELNVSQDSTGGEKQVEVQEVEERSQDSKIGAVAGLGEQDSGEAAQEDAGSAKDIYENLLSAGASVETKSCEVGNREHSRNKDTTTENGLPATSGNNDTTFEDGVHVKESSSSSMQASVSSVSFADGLQNCESRAKPGEEQLPNEASEVKVKDDSSAREEKGEPETDSPAFESEPSAVYSPLDEDAAGEDFKGRMEQGEVLAVNGKLSAESTSSVLPSPEVPVSQSSQSTSDEDENLKSRQQVIQNEESSLEQDNEEHQSSREVSSPPLQHFSLLAPLAGGSEPCGEQSKPPPPETVPHETENFADAPELPTFSTAEDLSKERTLLEPAVAEDQSVDLTRQSEQSHSASSDGPQSSGNPEKGMATDEEESYQECMSHDSSSLSTSRSSVTASSEQETFSAGTQGIGEEDQEETSRHPSQSAVVEVPQAHSHPETLLDKVVEDQVTVTQTNCLNSHSGEQFSPYEDGQEQVAESKKADVGDTLGPSSNDSFLNPADETKASDSLHFTTDIKPIEDNEKLDLQPYVPVPSFVQSTQSVENDVVGSVSGAGVDQLHIAKDSLGTARVEKSFISLGDSPACTDSSDLSKGDEGVSVDSPGAQEVTQNGGGQSSELPVAERGSQLPSPASEVRLPVLDRDDLASIDDNAWDEQLGEQNSFASTASRRNSTGSIKQSGNLHSTNGAEELCIQKNVAVSGSPTRSLSKREMASTSNVVDLPDESRGSQVLLESPSSIKEDVERLRSQSDVSVSGSSSAGKATVEVEESKVQNEGAVPADDYGTGGPSVLADKMSSVGSQSARKLPISKAKSVRTLSLTPSSQCEPSTDGRLSPDGATPGRSVTVVSPESLQWEPSKKGVPASFRRDADDSASAGNEMGKWNSQVLDPSSPPLRRNLAYPGEQASSFPATDTYLERPTYQSFETDVKTSEENGRVAEGTGSPQGKEVSVSRSPTKLNLPPPPQFKSMESPGYAVSERSPNAAVKEPKSKCGCTIM